MGLTSLQIAEQTGQTYRQVVATCRQAGIQPLHYVRGENRKMVAVYSDDVLDRINRSGAYAQVAAELGVTPQRLAEVILKYLPAGSLALPVRYRTQRQA